MDGRLSDSGQTTRSILDIVYTVLNPPTMTTMEGTGSTTSGPISPSIPLSRPPPYHQQPISNPCPFLGLPSDILRRLLSQFCTGKTLSTLKVALEGSSNHRDAALKSMIDSVLEERLEKLPFKKKTESEGQLSSSKNYTSEVQRCLRYGAACMRRRVAQDTSTTTTAMSPVMSTASITSTGVILCKENTSNVNGVPSIPWVLPALIDYLEQKRTRRSVWCGCMEFPALSPGDISGAKTRIEVVLQSSPCSWTRKALCEWNRTSEAFSCRNNSQSEERNHERDLRLICLSQPQPYNFVPIPPYGRILGKSLKSEQELKRIGEYLDAYDLVITLPDSIATAFGSASTCSGRRRTINRQHQGRMIIRIISPNQARERVRRRLGASSYRPPDWSEVVGESKESNMTVVDGRNQEPDEGLVCCWEYEGGDDDTMDEVATARPLEAILRILIEFHRPCNSEEDA